MWYEMADKKQWKRYVGYVSFPVIQHWKRSGCCKYNDTAAGESGERNENSCNYL